MMANVHNIIIIILPSEYCSGSIHLLLGIFLAFVYLHKCWLRLLDATFRHDTRNAASAAFVYGVH